MSFRILTANIYYKNEQRQKDYDLISALNPTSVGMQEYTGIGTPRGYKANPNDALIDGEQTDGHREVQIFIKKRKKLIDHTRLLGSPRVPNDKLAHDRWMDVAVFRHDRRNIAHINTHLNAGIQGPEGRPLLQFERTHAYIRHMVTLEKLIRNYKTQGFDVFVTMDSNYLLPRDLPAWEYSPYTIQGMNYVSNRLDGILYDPDKWELRNKRVIENHGSDHLWLLCRFKKI